MFEQLNQWLSGGPVYVRFSPRELSLVDVASGRRFQDQPRVAIKSGRVESVVAVGAAAGSVAAGAADIRLANGFEHPRCVVGDFLVAEKTLAYGLRQLYANRLIRPSPVMILHPLRPLEGGLAQIEVRAVKELGLAVGAREAHVWTGRELGEAEIREGRLPRRGWCGATPKWIRP